MTDEPVDEKAGDRRKRSEPRGPRKDGAAPRRARTASAPPSEEPPPGERIAKRLARAGIASRRDAEALIEAGRVKVNGRTLSSPALNVLREDAIEVDGMPLPPLERTRLFLFNKPAGVVTTNRDPEGRRTVFDVLPEGLPRLVTVGRLDINTEGLLLLTNDGGLARVLELPATGWLRRYRVRVHGKVDETKLAELKDGIAVDGVFYGSVEASLDREQGSNAWLTIGLREGKNREVKTILGALGLEVARLIRVSFGPFQLNELPEGHVQEMKGRMLRDQLGERLIEEAGADFEGEIVKPFSNKPTVRVRDTEPPTATGQPRSSLRVGEGGLVKRRHARDAREEALGRLSTSRAPVPRGRPDGDRKPGGRTFDDKRAGEQRFGEKRSDAMLQPKRSKAPRELKPIEPPGGRTTNVWMAPGARPLSVERKADATEVRPKRSNANESFRKPRGESEARSDAQRRPGRAERANVEARTGDRAPFKPRGNRPDRDGKSAFGNRKPFVKRGAREGEAGAAPRPPRARPEGNERPRRFDKPDDSGKPRGEFKPRAKFKPRGDRPFGDKPGFKGKPRPGGASGRPAEAKFGSRPGGKFGGKPGDRPSGGRPSSGGGSYGGRPGGSRPRPRSKS